MKADLSRNTFDRALHFSAVRLQQGRIVTDADWNEQADLTRYRAERQARDTIGACGAPLDAAGYALVAETNALAVHALNANVAWIAAEDGALLRTTNGGADWTLVDLATSAHLRAVAQVGGIGWAVGDGGVVRKTINSGRELDRAGRWHAGHVARRRRVRCRSCLGGRRRRHRRLDERRRRDLDPGADRRSTAVCGALRR